MGGNKYTEKDAAKDTNTSTSKVAEAWHDARDDDDSLVERSINKLNQKDEGEKKK